MRTAWGRGRGNAGRYQRGLAARAIHLKPRYKYCSSFETILVVASKILSLALGAQGPADKALRQKWEPQ